MMDDGASPLVAPLLRDGFGDSAWPAVQDATSAVSYGELRRHLLHIRDDLHRAGIGEGDRVAICMPKSIGMLELILGTLAAGAAYVPLNHRLPPAQLNRIVADLCPALLIAGPDVPMEDLAVPGLRVARGSILPGGRIDAPLTSPGAMPRLDSPAGLAALLYTSGSTGEPKGIMLSHDNLAGFVDWGARTFRIRAADRVASRAPFHFDLSVFDIFCTLRCGGTIHLIDDSTGLFPGAVRAAIERNGISVWYSVPTALVRLQERRALRDLASLRLILFAGEVFPMPSLRQLMNDLPGAEYANLYGPTETNVCTWYRLPAVPRSDDETLPVGVPCDAFEVTIRDPHGMPAAAGQPGEICVAGPGVMLGYWRQPLATQASRVGGRADSYRTGDYGFVRPDGLLMLQGRRDQQVKHRGHRIELLAVEAAVNAHPAVRESVAATAGDAAQGELVVFVAPRERPPSAAGLREFVAARLAPQYVPDRIEWVQELPLTATGKVDRAALKAHAAGLPERAAE